MDGYDREPLDEGDVPIRWWALGLYLIAIMGFAYWVGVSR